MGIFISHEAAKYCHVFLPTIIKDIKTGPFTESID